MISLPVALQVVVCHCFDFYCSNIKTEKLVSIISFRKPIASTRTRNTILDLPRPTLPSIFQTGQKIFYVKQHAFVSITIFLNCFVKIDTGNGENRTIDRLAKQPYLTPHGYKYPEALGPIRRMRDLD